jgi:murein DD-endopeptidase MepM/ murein hydrolase activator NlpD
LTSSRGLRYSVTALVLASFISVGNATAQQNTTQQQPTNQQPQTSQQTTPPKPEAPAEKTEQKVEEADEQGIITPPAPAIVKKDPNAIAIPAEEVGAEPKFEERPAASSAVKIGSIYGYRRDPFTRRARFHSGLDIKARWGDPVGASHTGVIQFAGWYHGYGNLIIVDHGGGVTTYYAHLTSFELGVGARVARGTVVGYAGSTGRATSPHLHYEVRIEGKPVNPLQPLALDPTSGYFTQSQPAIAFPVDSLPSATKN